MTPEIIGSFVRAILQALAGGLVLDGVTTESTLTTIAGGITAVITVVWSIWQKKAAKK